MSGIIIDVTIFIIIIIISINDIIIAITIIIVIPVSSNTTIIIKWLIHYKITVIIIHNPHFPAHRPDQLRVGQFRVRARGGVPREGWAPGRGHPVGRSGRCGRPG